MVSFNNGLILTKEEEEKKKESMWLTIDIESQSRSEREPRPTSVADWRGSEEIHRGLQQGVY